MTLFGELALVVVIAAALGVLAHMLKQPTLVGYLLAGFIIGPFGYLKLVNLDIVHVLAEVGIALLLFMIGLEMNPRMNFREFREFGKPAVYTGVGQIFFTFIAGFFLVMYLGFGMLASAYISIALTFSSTVIVVRLLSEKKDLNSLYGKIVIGFLLVQDFFAILALIFLAGLSRLAVDASVWGVILSVFLSFLKGGALLAASIFLSRRVFPRILDALGRSQEALFLFSIAWGLGLAALMATPWIGFSIEIGGFLAGLALASSITHFQIAGHIKPIRDFFVMLFFVALGAQLVVGNFAEISYSATVLSLFVLIGNPLIVMFIMAFLGYRSRTSFLASLTVAQISEFSLILAALGLRLGHLDERAVSLVTFVGIITITISSYFILHGSAIYEFMKRGLKFFEWRRGVAEKSGGAAPHANHVVLVGAHRMGSNIMAALKAVGEPFVVVDFDPLIVEALIKKNVPVIYGDITDEEIQELAGIGRARVIISTGPDAKDSAILLALLKRENPGAIIVLTAETEWEAKRFYEGGADYVILPHFVGGLQIAQAIKSDKGFNQLEALKEHDLGLLLAD